MKWKDILFSYMQITPHVSVDLMFVVVIHSMQHMRKMRSNGVIVGCYSAQR